MPRARTSTVAPAAEAPPPAPMADGEAEFRAALRAATGTADKRLQSTLLNEVFASLGTPSDAEEKASRCGAALALMSAFEPRNAVEAMLAGQAVALNAAGHAALRRAANPHLPPEIPSRLRRDAANAFRAVVEMAAAIEARRGGTHQRVTVEQ